jgi:formylglycine-generating enzyme required for sulfatase activity
MPRPSSAGCGSKQTDVSARRALLLSLGEYRPALVPPSALTRLVDRLALDYRDDPDPGIHGAIEWLLRQWQRDGALPRLRNHRPRAPSAGRPTWYVNGQGQTLALVPGPLEFLMGSPPTEADRSPNERRHRRRIGRSFAVGTKEVTVAEFRRFLKANPDLHKRFDDNGQGSAFLKQFSPRDEGPVVVVNWYMAAAYCNWLSQQEGIPETEWCYKKDPSQGLEGMAAVKGYLTRKGYRLPTEAEWEYACRAGAATSRFYGRSPVLLGRYAWYQDTSRERAHPVGRLRPNDLGLFDMLGNAAEWCQDVYGAYPAGESGRPVTDVERMDSREGKSRVMRGAGFSQLARDERCASREAADPTYRMNATGLRVARTAD